MKLADHVEKLRDLIEGAFDKHFARLGIGKNKQLDIQNLPEAVRPKRLRFEEMLENHIGETGGYERAREKLIDELTFTLFNRLAAVKVMEAAALFPPILTKQPEHGDRSFGHKAWLEMNPHMRSEELEGIREYLKTAFDELGETLPLYSRDYPYALLPDAISLNEIIDAFNTVEKDSQVGSDIWQSDDVLGWMYESYNNKKKQAHKDSKDKTEYNKVSLQSQVYTPRWVVQFLVENSLGKLYLEMYPNSEIRKRYKIANAPQTQERKPKPLHEVKTIDPACGSGNFLLYAFDFFYELYVDQIDNYGADYEEKEIPKLIIENNLHGIDLDDRAVQLAQLGLFIKAKKKRRSIGELAFNVVSSDFYLPEYDVVKDIFEPQMDTDGHGLLERQKELIREIWDDLKFAYKFGSLIRISERISNNLKGAQERSDKGELFAWSEKDQYESFAATFFANLKTAVEQYAQAQGNTFLTSKTRDAITFLELLTTEYDVATANPPYTDSSDFGPELKEFIGNNYKKPYKFHTNLYATFINRCYDFTGNAGFVAMLHPLTFMYIKTFEGVRKFMLTKTNVNLLAELGLGGVFANSDVQVDVAMYVLEKMETEVDGTYFDLKKYKNHTNKPNIFRDIYENYVSGISDEHVFTIPQSKLKIIKSWPFIYWISDEFREKFGLSCLEDVANATVGINSGGNERFLRFWWEVEEAVLSKHCAEDKLKWVGYAKGGPFNKWYGNNWLRLNWLNDGSEVINAPKSIMRNSSFYFKEGVTYSASGSKGVSFRYLNNNNVFDVGGSSIFLKDDSNVQLGYFLGFLNSKLCLYVTDCLNPTVNTQVGDLKRIPVVKCVTEQQEEVGVLVNRNICIKKQVNSFSLYEVEFDNSPLLNFKEFKPRNFFNFENLLLTQVLINEAIINDKIFGIYELTERDKAMVLAKEGESIGGLPILAEAREAYLAEYVHEPHEPHERHEKEEINRNHVRDSSAFRGQKNDFALSPKVVDFINTLPAKEFTAEERERC